MAPRMLQCDECLRTVEHHFMWDSEHCTECAKHLGLFVQPDNSEQIKHIAQEKVRVKEENKEAFNKEMEARAELAERALSRRRLLPFIKRVNPDYLPGWVHADICERLERFARDIEEGKSPRLMITMPPRHGKQMAHATPVLTQNRGWTTHGELVVGDLVFTPSGEAVAVLALSEETPSDAVVSLTNGESFRCHVNHEWTVYDRRQSKWRTVSTQWLGGTKLVNGPVGQRGGRYNIQLPLVSGLITPEVDLPFDPYTLGAWLGDGSRGKPCISGDVKDYPIIEKINNNGFKTSAVWVHKDTGVVTTSFAKQGFIQGLRALGCLHDKFIPEMYLQAGVEQRFQLLAGLIDTDGSCDNRTGRTRFTTADIRLANDVEELVRGLGFKPNRQVVQPRLSSSGIQGRQEYYVVGFQQTRKIPCALERKTPDSVRMDNRRTAIASVTLSPNGEVGRCIQVDAEDGLYLVGRTLTPTHNSEIGSKTFPSWYLGRNPKHEVMVCSYSGDLAKDFSRKCRDLLVHPKYTSVFKTRLSKDSKSVERWNTSDHGAFTAAGVGGPITGRGCSLGIIDDPVKNREEAESETTRQNVKDWYSSAFYTRLAPGGGILIIQTRWHDDDLSGWLLSVLAEAKCEALEEGVDLPAAVDKWELVEYPAIATQDEKFRSRGEALHADRYPIEALEKIKFNMIPRDWEALYQQRPVSEDGDYFKKEMFKYYKPGECPPLEEMRLYAAGDLAISTKQTADYTVFVVLGVDRQQNIWIVDTIRGRWGSLGIIDRMFEIQVKYNPELFGLEAGQIELTLEPFIQKAEQERGVSLRYEKLKTRGADKGTRARTIQGRMEQGRVYFPTVESTPWMSSLQNELLKFPLGKNDDQVDALAWVGHMLMMFGVRNEKKAPPKKSFRDKLRKYQTGSRGSRSAASA